MCELVSMRGARSAAARAYSALARSTRNFARSRRASGFCGAAGEHAVDDLLGGGLVAQAHERDRLRGLGPDVAGLRGQRLVAHRHRAAQLGLPRELPAEGLRPVARLDVLAAVRQVRLLDQEAGQRHVRRRRLGRGALSVFQLAHAVLVPLVVAETPGRQRPMERQGLGDQRLLRRAAAGARLERGQQATPAGRPRGPPRSPSRPARGPGRRARRRTAVAVSRSERARAPSPRRAAATARLT